MCCSSWINPSQQAILYLGNVISMQGFMEKIIVDICVFIFQEFFSGKGPSSGVPEVEGFLHIKADSKSWAKKYCVLRSSGLYVSKSGEPKKGKRVTVIYFLIK